MRDAGALQSALKRPQNKFGYGKPNLFELAAAYACGVAANHPFNDGNKRTAYVASLLFLSLNGFRIEAGYDEKYPTFLRLAAGELSESGLAGWFKQHALKVKS